MWNYPEEYDVIVVGAGHAGCEAAHAAAKMGAKTLLLTMNLDTIAKMSCNPAIGGTAKGHLVREIDALGGIMGKIADRTGIQYRMLNASKGPAVWSPRCQSDKSAYALEMKSELEKLQNLDIQQGTTTGLIINEGKIQGVETKEQISYLGKTVIISSGTFMKGMIHIGDLTMSGGRSGDPASLGLSKTLSELGFSLGRLKTGTPPRINALSLDFSKMEEQPGDEGVHFSHERQEKRLRQVSCYIAYTNKKTEEIVNKNLKRSSMYSGKISSKGPRYCPSIEDKYQRFQDKERHQLFLEPEGLTTQEIYVNGISTSLPFDVQFEMIRSIEGMENAKIMRPGYAIEYDYVLSGQQYETLETKLIENLFFAGQINGTTGYEEAAGQGLLAGINAALKVRNKPSFALSRSESYLGVMISDLITKDLTEPYRMFTSRAEHRLLLRQDNADLRLREYGFDLGLISKKQQDILLQKKQEIEEGINHLKNTSFAIEGRKYSLAQVLCRPEMTYRKLKEEHPALCPEYSDDALFQIELNLKYEGYIKRQQKEAEKLKTLEKQTIPKKFNFLDVKGLRKEAQEKLQFYAPSNIGEAIQISGVSPADITVLLVALKRPALTKS